MAAASSLARGTLVRAGSCPTQSGILDLSQNGITELPARCDGFQCGIHGTTYQRTGDGTVGRRKGPVGTGGREAEEGLDVDTQLSTSGAFLRE